MQPPDPTRAPFSALPSTGYVRQAQLIANRAHPGPSAPLPFSHATLWRLVKSGNFPKPVKLSERVTAWRVEDVREWMQAKSAA